MFKQAVATLQDAKILIVAYSTAKLSTKHSTLTSKIFIFIMLVFFYAMQYLGLEKILPHFNRLKFRHRWSTNRVRYTVQSISILASDNFCQ